jgi:predicted RNA-binding protein YlqC (UPF0109 family)
VDVNKNVSSINHERGIIIRGQRENCVKACREILQIMYTDGKTKNRTSEPIVKILAPNNYIGRIIGKGGNIINTIKKETETSITVSSSNEHFLDNSERIISVQGDLEQQLRAVEMIHSKLCSAFEQDQTRGWNYVSGVPTLYQQYPQQIMQYLAPQGAASETALLSNRFLPASNNANNTSVNSNAILQPSFYVSQRNKTHLF